MLVKSRLIGLCLFVFLSYAKTIIADSNDAKIDSLLELVGKANDTERYQLYNQIYLEYKKGDQGKAFKYCIASLRLSKKLHNKSYIANSYNLLASIYQFRGQLDSTLIFYNKAVSYYREDNNEEGLATIFNRLGVFYRKRGEKNTALKYEMRSLTLMEQLQDSTGIAKTLD